MDKRWLGQSGISVPPLCLGGNVFGWTADEAKSFRILDRAIERGLNFVDTADVYTNWIEGNPGGVSESIIGKWMKARNNRAAVVVATKVGARMSREKKGLSAAYIRSAVEESLKRLETDYIDLYQSHFPDPRTPLDETLGAFDGLIRAGKVRAIGTSNQSREKLAEAIALQGQSGLPKYATLQPEYNLYKRAEFEEGLADICRDNGIGVLSYYSLASGFLTGKYRSAEATADSARKSELAPYFTPRGFRILAALDEVAQARRVHLSAIALAWLMGRPTVVAPIASASSEAQVDQLSVALSVELSAEEKNRLDQASALTPVDA